MLTLGHNLLFPSGTELTKESVACHWTLSHLKSILLFVFYTFNPRRVGVNQNQKLYKRQLPSLNELLGDIFTLKFLHQPLL